MIKLFYEGIQFSIELLPEEMKLPVVSLQPPLENEIKSMSPATAVKPLEYQDKYRALEQNLNLRLSYYM